jgi:PKD repeat protein
MNHIEKTRALVAPSMMRWLVGCICLFGGYNLFAQCPPPVYFKTGETFTITAQSGITGIQWQVDNGSGYTNIIGATNQAYIVTNAGKYRYIAQDQNNCTISLCCPADFLACPNTTYTLCTGESYTLTAQSGLTNIQWQRDTGAGYTDIVGANNPTYIATTIGKYKYTAKDANGCTITQCCVFDIMAGCCKPNICLPVLLVKNG